MTSRCGMILEKLCRYRAESASTNNTLFHYCAEHGSVHTLRLLLKNGMAPAVNAQNSMRMTPLMVAITEQHEEIIEMLLEAGADMFILNRLRESALDMVFADQELSANLCKLFLHEFRKKCSSSEEAAQLLIDAGCRLYQAAHLKDARIMECMLEQGLSSNSANPFNVQTALHIAVGLDDIESVKLLIRYGADIESADIRGRTPLYYLYRCNTEHTSEKLEILRVLLNLEVARTSCTSKGFFQIECALAYGCSKAIHLILESNIDFSARDQFDGRSILHYLAVNANPGVIEELKLHTDKFDVNVLDKSGVNSLYCAILNGNYAMVEFLLEHGTKPYFLSPFDGINDCTPLYYAYKKSRVGFEDRYDRCAELLLQHNADPQFIINKTNGGTVTVFDIVPQASSKIISLGRVKPVIAQLALLERLGTPITEIIRSKIDSRSSLNKYLHKCQRVLEIKIYESITVFKLLTTNERKMAKYLNKKELVIKLKRIAYKQKFKSSYSYYYNTLKKYISRGMAHKTLRDNAAKGVCKIFKNRIDKTNIITDNVIAYLNNQDLRQLYRL